MHNNQCFIGWVSFYTPNPWVCKNHLGSGCSICMSVWLSPQTAHKIPRPRFCRHLNHAWVTNRASFDSHTDMDSHVITKNGIHVMRGICWGWGNCSPQIIYTCESIIEFCWCGITEEEVLLSEVLLHQGLVKWSINLVQKPSLSWQTLDISCNSYLVWYKTKTSLRSSCKKSYIPASKLSGRLKGVDCLRGEFASTSNLKLGCWNSNWNTNLCTARWLYGHVTPQYIHSSAQYILVDNVDNYRISVISVSLLLCTCLVVL